MESIFSSGEAELGTMASEKPLRYRRTEYSQTLEYPTNNNAKMSRPFTVRQSTRKRSNFLDVTAGTIYSMDGDEPPGTGAAVSVAYNSSICDTGFSQPKREASSAQPETNSA